jgi:hypothetical protein
MNFNFLSPFFSPEMFSTGFNPAAPNPLAGLTPIGPGPTTAGMPVASVDLLGDQLAGGAFNPYALGNDFADGSAPGGFGGGFLGTGYAQEAGDVPAAGGYDWAGLGDKFKKLGGMESERGQRPQAPMLSPPQAGGGGRTFDVTPFLRQPVLRRGK